MIVNLRTRIICNLLLYVGLSYIVSKLIGSLTYSLIIHSNAVALHIFICEMNGDCKHMKIGEYLGHILAIAALTFGVEAGLVELFRYELTLQSLCWLVVYLTLIQGGIAYELKDVEV